MKEVKVSVVIPAYNCSCHIAQAIDSVLAQQVSLQVIVIDDGSGDNLDKVMERYQAEDRVHYYKNKSNLGVAATRNKGVALSACTYVAFLDADDWWEPMKLEKQIALMEKKQAILSYTGRSLCKESGESTGKIIHAAEEIDYRTLLRGNAINCSSVVVRKEIISQFAMAHDDAHEDYITWLAILKKYGKAYGIDEPLLNYRLSEGGKSRNKIKSALMTYKVYRYSGFGRVKSCWYFAWYVVNALKKYK